MRSEKKQVLMTAVRRVQGHVLTYELFHKAGAYGIAVSADGKTETAEDLTDTAEKAGYLLGLLAEGTVFPENLWEVLDDLLGTAVW